MRQRHEKIADIHTYPKRYVSLLQLAEYLGMERRTIYYHVEKGALQVVKRVGVIRVPIEEARRYASFDAQSVQ